MQEIFSKYSDLFITSTCKRRKEEIFGQYTNSSKKYQAKVEVRPSYSQCKLTHKKVCRSLAKQLQETHECSWMVVNCIQMNRVICQHINELKIHILNATTTPTQSSTPTYQQTNITCKYMQASRKQANSYTNVSQVLTWKFWTLIISLWASFEFERRNG